MLKKNMKWIILASIILLVSIIAISFMKSPDVGAIVREDGYKIVSQNKKSLEITLCKKELPSDIDFEKGVKFTKDDIKLYQTNTTVMYLKSIKYAENDKENLMLTFDFSYDLPKAGKILLPYEYDLHSEKEVVNSSDVNSEFFRYVYTIEPSEDVADDTNVFNDAVMFNGNISERQSEEEFSIYLKKDVYDKADEELVLTIDGFNEIVYE